MSMIQGANLYHRAILAACELQQKIGDPEVGTVVWDQKICDCSNCATSILLQTWLSADDTFHQTQLLCLCCLNLLGCVEIGSQCWCRHDSTLIPSICGLKFYGELCFPGNQERLLWADNAGKQETSCTFVRSQNMFRQKSKQFCNCLIPTTSKNRSNCLISMMQPVFCWTSVSFLTLVCPISTHSSNLIT